MTVSNTDNPTGVTDSLLELESQVVNCNEDYSARLQQQAEQYLADMKDDTQGQKIAKEHFHEILHKLRVHEVELQMQNEELMKIQDELVRSRDRYTKLYNFAPAGHFTFDNKGNILELNLNAASLLGLERARLCGKPLILYLPPAYHHVFYKHLEQVVASNQPHSCELELIPYQGQPFFVSMTSNCDAAVDDETRCVRSVLLDMDEKRRAQLALEARSHELERSNQQLHVEISAHAETIEKLHLAKETADAANRAKTTFLSNISHELRTPLNAILGYAQLLQREGRDDHAQSYATQIYDNGQQLLGLLNDVLDLTKMESERLELSAKPIELESFLLGVLQPYQIQAHNKGLSFSYEFGAPPGYALPGVILSDPQRLRQILMHLLGNAVKFTETGGVWLEVNYLGGNFHIIVRDTGCGIAESEQSRLFQPFYQIGNVYNKSPGSGLGLAITRQLVELMGGGITLSSTLGKGSQFDLLLPLPVVSEAPRPAPRRAAAMLSGICGYTGARRVVLVIDDQERERQALRMLLEPLGFVVVDAEGGGSGIQAARKIQPDIILLDLIMPGMDGFSTARTLRMDAAVASIPIVAMSSEAFDYHRQQSQTVGCVDFFTKPVQLDDLVKIIGKQLDIKWTSNKSTDALPASVLPPLRHLAALRDLAKAGDIGSISDYAVRIKNERQEWADFAEQLARLAEEFQVKKLCQFIDNYIEAYRPNVV